MDLSATERAVLTGPDRVARAAAAWVGDREARWMLRQPRAVRRSFAEAVLSSTDERAQERWMLQQPDSVRLSYVRDVLDADS
jgi:hypothetical protein